MNTISTVIEKLDTIALLSKKQIEGISDSLNDVCNDITKQPSLNSHISTFRHNVAISISLLTAVEYDLDIPQMQLKDEDKQTNFHHFTGAICTLIRNCYLIYIYDKHLDFSVQSFIDTLQTLSLVTIHASGHLEESIFAKKEAVFVLLYNMLSNATSRGNATTVEINCKKHKEYLEITLKDNGEGIKLPKGTSLESIFQKGVSSHGSSGLGLQVDQNDGIYDMRAEAHGGLVNKDNSQGALISFKCKLSEQGNK